MATPYPAISSGEKTSSAIIKAGKCGLTAVLVITDGSNAATVILYDNATEATGKKIAEFLVAGATGYGGRNWTYPVRCDNGIYCSISGTGASAIVEYI